jgi:hypothetical protein
MKTDGLESNMLAKHLAIFLPSLRGGGAERVMVTLANGCARTASILLRGAEGPYRTEVGRRAYRRS